MGRTTASVSGSALLSFALMLLGSPPAGSAAAAFQSNPGLSGAYYDTAPATAPAFPATPTLTRQDASVDFSDAGWAPTTGTFPPGSFPNADGFLVRWTGYVQGPFSGSITFHILTDDGARLWVNSQQLVNSWIDQAPTAYQGSTSLVMGNWYPITLEFYENAGGARIQLAWSWMGQAQTVITSASMSSTLPPPPPPPPPPAPRTRDHEEGIYNGHCELGMVSAPGPWIWAILALASALVLVRRR